MILDHLPKRLSTVETGDGGSEGSGGSIKCFIVQTLPASNIDPSAIYFVPTANPDTNNTYDEYMYINNIWEKIGGNNTKQTVTQYTMTAGGWSGGYYSFESTWPSSAYNITVNVCDATTSAQLTAYADAAMVGSISQNRVKATGTVPSVDIIVAVTATTK